MDINRVAIFCDFLSLFGGTEYYCAMLAIELKKRGIDVRVFILEKPENKYWINLLDKNNILHYESQICQCDFIDKVIEKKFISLIVDNFQNWFPDIIHTSPAGFLAISFLEDSPNNNIPIVATEYTTPSAQSGYWYHKELPKHINKFHAFIATCRASAIGIRDYHGYTGYIEEIGHLINKPKLNKENALQNTVGCIARLSPEKGIEFLLGAWKKVLKYIPDAKLYIYGQGIYEDYYKDLTRALALSGYIQFYGTFNPISEFSRIAQKHKIFVQPSLFESIPTSLIELMSCSRAIVATDVGGIRELINKDTGILVKSASTDSLANALIKLLSCKTLQKKYAKNSSIIFKARYSLNKNINDILNLYKRILTQKNKKI